MAPDLAIRAVAALNDDLRRGMYAHIRQVRRSVTRDEAAVAAGISRKLAAFHLDKLVDAGLLRSRYQAVGDSRRVGRRPKVYELSDNDIAVNLPPRQHDVLATILLDAILTEGDGETGRAAAVRVARMHGEQVGSAERQRSRLGRLGAERALTVTSGVLERYGFEPVREQPTCVRLRNCPFHPLAQRSPATVCGINKEFLGGLLTGIRAPTVDAVLAPRSGECCVELRGRPA